MFSVSICNVYLHYHIHLQKKINGKIIFYKTLILLLCGFESMNGHVYATNNFMTRINEKTLFSAIERTKQITFIKMFVYNHLHYLNI